MPLNMPSHVHGQGYADANFLIPELFSTVDVRKGPLFRRRRRLSPRRARCTCNISTSCREGLVSASGGSFAWGRLLGAKSWAVGDGELFAAIEGNIYNGPWERPDEARKINGVVRWSQGTQDNGLRSTAMAYSNHWFGDRTDSAASRWMRDFCRAGERQIRRTEATPRATVCRRAGARNEKDYWTRVEGFIIRNDFNLYTNTTSFQANPTLGDQFHQFDRRSVYGFNAVHGLELPLREFSDRNPLRGARPLRRHSHRLLETAVERTELRRRSRRLCQGRKHGLWTDTTVRWTPWLRTTVGARFDYFHARCEFCSESLFLPRFRRRHRAYRVSLPGTGITIPARET